MNWTNEPTDPQPPHDTSEQFLRDRAELLRAGRWLIGSGFCLGLLTYWLVRELLK